MRILGIILIAIFIYSNILDAELKPSGEPIQLVFADSLVGNQSENGNIRECIGNVHLRQGDIDVFSDKAIQYLETNDALLIGNVKITQKEMTLKSPYIKYYGATKSAHAQDGLEMDDGRAIVTSESGIYDTRSKTAFLRDSVKLFDESTIVIADSGRYERISQKAYFKSNVVVDSDSALIKSDAIIYDKSSKRSESYGNVLVIGKYNSIRLSTDTLIDIPSMSYTIAKGQPLLLQIDSTAKINQEDDLSYSYDSLLVSSDIMKSIGGGENKLFEFSGKVKLIRNELTAKCDSLRFYKNEGLIVLMGLPVVWYDSTQIHADSINVIFPNNEISQIQSFGNALAAMKEDTLFAERINQIIGNSIFYLFDQDTLNAIHSYGDAKSLFFISSEDSDNSAARNSADSIVIDFFNGEPYEFIGIGGNQGEYFPEKIYENDTKSYYLPTYRWQNDKPVKKDLNPDRLFK